MDGERASGHSGHADSELPIEVVGA